MHYSCYFKCKKNVQIIYLEILTARYSKYIYNSKWFHFPYVRTNLFTVCIGVIFIYVNNSKNNATNVCRNNKSWNFVIA